MNNLTKERMLDLLTDRILFGLNPEETAELESLERLFPSAADDVSLELTVSAVGLTNLETIEPLPAELRTKIAADADQYFAKTDISREIQQTFEFERKSSFTQWLGWAFAGVAGIALAFSVWSNVQKPSEIVREVPRQVPTINEQYDSLIASAKDLRKTAWVNPKNDKEVIGEVVWSESEQKGFMKFTGLAKNDVSKEDYQLWIFDETQDEKTPIDGGIFDVASNGEVLIPIKANLKFKNPKLFAITREKEGGVMVSDRKNLVALGKV